jgi:hypothetical protein
VALMTLTRPKIPSHNGPVTTFRLEGILPGKEEEDEGLGANVPLFGMTVGPLQEGKVGSRPRRWRLILHYYDHTILSYEVYRDEEMALEVL